MTSNQPSFPFIRLDEVDSTNNYAMNLVRQGLAGNFTCIWALAQVKGKGQRGNIWLSEAGKNLTCSLIFYPSSLEVADNFCLSMTVSLAALKFLSYTCKDVRIKWPNDLMLNGKKTGGILIENTIEKQKVKSCVIGLGINLNQTDFPSDIPTATSVLLNSGKTSNVEESLHLLYKYLVQELKVLDLKNYAAIKSEYMEKLFGLGLNLKFRDSAGDFTGIIRDVQNTGEIIISDQEGRLRSYSFKEVEMLQ